MLLITVIPPFILGIIYTFCGGLALFMFLMGMSSVIAVEIWIFHVYFNFESENCDGPLTISQDDRLEVNSEMNRIQMFKQQESQRGKINGIKNTDIQVEDLSLKQQVTFGIQQSSQQKQNAAQSPEKKLSTKSVGGLIFGEKNIQDSGQAKDFLHFNNESTRIFQDIQSNPLTNLSPENFQALKPEDIIQKFGSQSITERLGSSGKRFTQNQLCNCRIEKDNFKLVIKAKSQKIQSFLGLIENFYLALMKNEQLNGRNLSRLGHPSIQLIGQFNELTLFKDAIFDDHQFLSQSIGKLQQRGQFAFCKTKLIRKVFNEIGVSHAENALFLKRGVLANISALNETLTLKIKQYQQKHLVLCEELDLSEKKLTKIRSEYAKDSKIVDESIQSYTKASQTINNYQKLLEQEMRFKLSYKKMQDTASKVSDALDYLCETREKFQNQTNEMISELWGLDRNKGEIFKSTIMSVVDTFHEFEVQYQNYFEECAKQSNLNMKQIVIQIENQKQRQISSLENSLQPSSSSGNDSIEQDEDIIFQRNRKRSIKFKEEEVLKFMNQIQLEESSFSNLKMSQNFLPSARLSMGTIGPKDFTKDYSILSVKGDDANEGYVRGSDTDEDFNQEEDLQIEDLDQQDDHLRKVPQDYNISPMRQRKFEESLGSNVMIFKENEIEESKSRDSYQPDVSNFEGLMSPKSQQRNRNESSQDFQELENKLSYFQNQNTLSLRQLQTLLQGAKDIIQFQKYMINGIKLYCSNLHALLEFQFENATHVMNEEQQNSLDLLGSYQQQTVKQIKQLKMKKDNNELLSKIWYDLISNFRSYIHQYESLMARISDQSQILELFVSQMVERRNQLSIQLKTQITKLKGLISQAKSLNQAINQISHLQVSDKSPEEQKRGVSTYQQYLKQYQSIKSKYLNQTGALSYHQSEKLSKQQIQDLQSMLPQKIQRLEDLCLEIKNTIKTLSSQIIQYDPLKKQTKDKIIETKSDLMSAHQERSKNSQNFFKNLMSNVEKNIMLEMDSSIEDDKQLIEQNLMIANEDKSQDLVFHKKECIYFNPQDLTQFQQESQKKQVSISPDKKSFSKDGDDFTQDLIRHNNEEFQESEFQSINSNQNRIRSKSAYKPSQETKDLTQQIESSLINKEEETQGRQKSLSNYSFNFGKQINIINNYGSNGLNVPVQNLELNISSDNIAKTPGQETANWFNKALSVFYQEWKSSQVFQNFILKEVYLVANKGRPNILSEIEVLKVTLHGNAPQFQKIQKLDSQPDEFLHDIDLSLRGTVEVLIKTEINFNWGLSNYYKIPIAVNILLKSINGKIRVFYSNDKSKGCWYGFVGKPVIKINLDPVIGKENKFSIKYIPKLRELIEDLMGKRFDKYCLPNKRPLSIPITKFTNIIWPRVVKQVEKSVGTEFTDILLSQTKKSAQGPANINEESKISSQSQNVSTLQHKNKTYEEFMKNGLQAVIIAESFQNKFKPLSHEKLKCMFPLANVQILHYVIEFLLMNKVTEIYIAVCIHRAQIDKFLKAQNYKGVKINVITLESSSNFGDALREINQIQTIKSEFILCRGDIITNVNIHGALREHFRSQALDKDRKLILTKLFVKVPFSNSIRSNQQEVALILDEGTKEIFKYESFSQNKKLKINEDFIPLKQQSRKYQIRYDLVDSDISICSKDVLNYFQDNFDYENLTDDFINQIQSSEIIEDRIIAYELNGYFARILDPRTYAEVTQDILSRYLHPMVVDSKLLFPNQNYTFHSLNKYFEQEVSIGLGSIVSNNCLIGKASKIGNHSSIERSTIGKNCHIGNNVSIRNSFIWNDVRIEDGSRIENAIICDKAVINKNSNILSGSLLSFGVVVKEGKTIEEQSVVSKYTFNSKDGDFQLNEESDKNDILEIGCFSYLPRECVLKPNETIGYQTPIDDDESDFDDDEEPEDMKTSEAFAIEVKKTIERTSKDHIINAITEVKSLRMSYNKDHSDCIESIIPALLDKVTEENLQKRSKQLQDLFNDWKELLSEFMRGGDADERTFTQFSLIRAIEIYCGTHDLFNNTFHIICQIIYQLKQVEPSILLKWNQQAKKSIESKEEDEYQDEIFEHFEKSKREKFIKDMAKFIDFLEKQASEEEEGEEEEEYDEEEAAEEEGEEEEEDDS